MTSIGYTLNSINYLMELVDENKHNYNENVYLEMCNILKEVFLNKKPNQEILNYIENRLNIIESEICKNICKYSELQRPRLNNFYKNKIYRVIALTERLCKPYVKIEISVNKCLNCNNNIKPINYVKLKKIYVIDEFKMLDLDEKITKIYIDKFYNILKSKCTSSYLENSIKIISKKILDKEEKKIKKQFLKTHNEKLLIEKRQLENVIQKIT